MKKPDSEKPESCYACQFETDKLKWYPPVPRTNEGNWFCKICASTCSGNSVQYPDLYRNEGKTLTAMAFMTNTILKAIKEKK